MATRGNLLVLAVAVVAAGVGFWAGERVRRAPIAPPPGVSVVSVGEPHADAALPDLEGRPRRLADWAGRPRLVNFWASWCGPCIAEMPLLQRFHQAQGADGIQVIGIALDDAEAVRAFLGRVPVDYPILLERTRADDLSVRLGNTRGVLPYTVLIGADGTVLAQRPGAFHEDTLAAFVAPALAP